MICNVCGHDRWAYLKTFKGPDKYELAAKINGPMPMRSWWRCAACGLYKCRHSYEPHRLKVVYTDSYRDKDFRQQSIEETFKKTMALPRDESENAYRVSWIWNKVKPGTMLDIGSGFGIFPYTMKWHGFDVMCMEPNLESAEFITNKLNMICECSFWPSLLVNKKFEFVTAVHVLEHIEDPEFFLSHMLRICNGKLYLEVPDAVEFEYLPDDHDEFNSCHLFFFTAPSLVKLLESVGFHVTDVHRVRTKARNLSRIMVLANA